MKAYNNPKWDLILTRNAPYSSTFYW